MSDDDDWETAPVAMLTLEDRMEKGPRNPDMQTGANSGGVIMPKHMQGRAVPHGIVNFINSTNDGAGAAGEGGSGTDQLRRIAGAKKDAPTDTILLEVLSSKDRMQLLKLEDEVVRFLQSNHDSLELPRQKNSYYAKAATSMLERFRLDWEPEGEEHGLIANRCSDTHMPVVLLIDLDTPGPGAGSGGGGGRAGVGNGPRGGVKDRGEAGGAQAAASGAGASKQPPKMTLMKRVPSKEGMERSKNKEKTSAEDLDRKYQDAKARIFGAAAAAEATGKEGEPVSSATSSGSTGAGADAGADAVADADAGAGAAEGGEEAADGGASSSAGGFRRGDGHLQHQHHQHQHHQHHHQQQHHQHQHYHNGGQNTSHDGGYQGRGGGNNGGGRGRGRGRGRGNFRDSDDPEYQRGQGRGGRGGGYRGNKSHQQPQQHQHQLHQHQQYAMPQIMYPPPMPGMHPNVFAPQVAAAMGMPGFIAPPGHYGGGVPMYGAGIPQAGYGMNGMMGGMGAPAYGAMFVPQMYPAAGMLPGDGTGTGTGGDVGGGGGGAGEKSPAVTSDPASG